MLGFFQELVLKAGGLDPEAIQEERFKKENEKRSDKVIFSKSAKVLIFIFGILYLVMQFSALSVMRQLNRIEAAELIWKLLLLVLDFAGLLCLSVSCFAQKRKMETAAFIIFVFFVLVQTAGLMVL